MGMGLKKAEGFEYLMSAGADAQSPCIYYLGLPQELPSTKTILEGFDCAIVYIVINDWDNQLTPWPAQGLYRGDPDFKGEAPQFLEALRTSLIPAIEHNEGLRPAHRGIAGYSLAGLFSVYAFANCSLFTSVASMSGSFWYEGWTDYVASLKLDKQGCSAFFSLGNRESKAREKILHSVQCNTNLTVRALESWGVRVQHHLVPGGHFDNVAQRVGEGLTALAKMLHEGAECSRKDSAEQGRQCSGS